MKIIEIPKRDLKKADNLQQRILNPEHKKRHRSFSYIYKNYLKELVYLLVHITKMN